MTVKIIGGKSKTHEGKRLITYFKIDIIIVILSETLVSFLVITLRRKNWLACSSTSKFL